MTDYYDTGVLLKLYTAEPESAAVMAFVRRKAEALRIHELHLAECCSAMRLKQFRGECTATQADQALGLISQDLKKSILRLVAVDWTSVWEVCRSLTDAHAAGTGARTLDTLHVACAVQLGSEHFVTSDDRQSKLADRAGLHVIDPTK